MGILSQNESSLSSIYKKKKYHEIINSGVVSGMSKPTLLRKKTFFKSVCE